MHGGSKGYAIYASSSQDPETFRLELTRQEALMLMGGVENYDRLVNSLKLENGEMVLLSPGNEE